MGVIQGFYQNLIANLVSLRREAARAQRESEQRFRQVVEAAPNAMVMVDQAGKITMVNRQAERTFGYARDELVGQPVELLVPERFRDHHPRLREAFFTDPTPRPMGAGRDLYAVKKDGSEFPVEIGLNPIETDEGLVVLSAIVDITQRKAAELALRDSERRYGVLVNGVTDYAIFMLDTNGIVTNWNRGAERIKGYSAEEIVGRNFSCFYTEEDRAAKLPQHALEIAAREGRYESESLRVRKDGSQFWAEVVIDALRDEDGRPIGFAKISRDITERLRAARELEEARLKLMQEELARANRLMQMGELAASISHEIKQPIAANAANAEAGRRWLSAQPPNLAEARQAFDLIVKDAMRVGQLMNHIHSLVQNARTCKERLQMNEAIREVIALTRGEAEKHRVVVRMQLAEDLPFVEGDGVQLQQVILNLIINAIEAMCTVDEGPRELTVSTSKDKSGSALIAVRDSGPGVTPQNVERLFEPFYTTKAGGLGMGLSICRSIIEAHGGRLWVNADLPRGTTFQFTVPATNSAS